MPLHQRPAVIYSLGALLLGGQLMSIGFLAELITAYQLPRRRHLFDRRTHRPTHRPARRQTAAMNQLRRHPSRPAPLERLLRC